VHRVDERRAEVDPAAGALEHLLDQVADLRVVEDGRGQLRPTAAGDEHPARLVDPGQRATVPYVEHVRVAIYCRISRDDAGDGLGVERQEQDCRALAARRGWTVVGTFVDNDVSAFSGRTRPDYERLLQAVKAGGADLVLAWAPERLHRSPRELEDFIELIERTATAVETVKAGAWDVSTSHGRLVARMLGAVARAESERTGERVSRAHQQAKDRGMWRGPIPYGMRASQTPGQPELDPLQADVTADIYERVLRGDALTRIAQDLNDRGVPPRRGKLWTHTGILRLISSPALGGLVEVDGELKEACFEGVVTATTWREARAAMRRRPRGESRRPRETLTLLGGIMTCDEHGWVCVGGSATHAATYVAGGPGKCHVSIKRAAADDLVTTVVLRRLARPDAADLFVPHDNVDTTAEMTELRQRREDLGVLVADGLLTASNARPKLTAIAERLAAIEAARTPARVDLALMIDPERVWGSSTMPQRREVLRVLLESVTLRHVGPAGGPRADPTRISIQWAAA